MSVIDDLTVYPELGPRLILIGAALDDADVQDIHDSLCAWQDSPDGHPFEVIVDSAGKEALGGGVTVGITTTLQNARIGFVANKSWAAVGAVTTGDTSGVTLTDTGATFIGSGVVPGSWVVNLADGSIATVLRVDSETQITTDALGAGAIDQWTAADPYRIMLVDQKSISGGNLVAVDEFDAAIDSIFPTAGNQVVRTNATSAALIEGSGSDPAAIADAVWDEVLTGNTHNVNKSAGKRLRELSAQIVHTGTAQGPAANGNQIELANDASALDGAYDPTTIAIVDGTGAGQSRNILQYEGATRIATVDRNWKLNPDATSEYVIYANAGREHVNEGLAQGGTSNTITLNALASSIDEVYLYQTIFIRSGTGDDQIGIVTAYDGATKIATIDGTWAVVPDATSAYAMLPTHNNVSTEQAISFNGVIHIDTASGAAGTAYPLGTHNDPSNNIADAKSIAATQGVDRFIVTGTLIAGPTDDISGFTFQGTNELIDAVAVTAGCVTTNTVFRSMTLTGAVGGGVFAEKCALVALSNIGSDTEPSLFNDCILLESTFTYRAGLTTPQKLQFINCVSGVTTGAGVIFDYNGTTTPSALRKYSGAVTLRNHSAAATSIWELDNGYVTIEPSCTNGIIALRGRLGVVDNSAGTTVDRDGSLFPAQVRNLMNAILGSVA